MKRSIAAASIAIGFASTITAALAQSPDFSPLPPRTVNGAEMQMDTQSSQGEATPAVEPASPTGRYLGETNGPAPSALPEDQVQDSSSPAYDATPSTSTYRSTTGTSRKANTGSYGAGGVYRDANANPYGDSARQPQIPTHSTIGHGLFNKSGPDDFGQ